MKAPFPTRTNSRPRGYILIGILFAVTIAIIALAAAVPAIRTRIKRDREEELIHRAHQYTRGIQLFYRKFGRYPASIEQLENTNNIRFIRQKYKDPITGKDEWKLLHFGQVAAKPRPAYLKGASPAGGASGGAGGQSSGQRGSGQGSQGQFGQTGAGTAGSGSGISNASDISKSLSGSSTLGGGPIVGLASTSDKEGLKEIDGKTKYNEWEFVYDPTLDPNAGRGQQPGAPNPGSPGAPGVPAGGIGTGGDRPSRPPR
ncbi:MAG: hypothetical protein JWO13_3454 [Acidobacteriales bacterium]|nr:hypothetical protein [Terriglobales bacterium]